MSIRFFLLLLILAARLEAQNNETAALSPNPIWPKGGLSAVPPELLHDNQLFYDPRNNQLVLLYSSNPDGSPKVHRFNLNNNVAPSMLFRVTKNAKNPQALDYTYTVSNGAKAKKAISNFHLMIGDTRRGLPVLAPQGWSGNSWGSPSPGPYNTPEMKAAIGVDDGGVVFFMKGAPAGEPVTGLAPGTSLTGFVVTSTFKPGFTMAYVQNAEGDLYSGDFLDGSGNTFVPWQHYALNSKHVVTIGPRFASDTPLQQIVADYIQGINRLIKQGDLKASSPFVQSVLATLNAAGSANPLTFTATPTTPFETQLLPALQAATK